MKKTIIQIDEKIHGFQKECDERREEIPTNMDLGILRFNNEELNIFADVLKWIENFIFR